MIREVAGHERTCLVRVKNQEEEGVWRSASLISLCLDSGGKEGERGELYHLYAGKPAAFCSLFDALNQMEELYDVLSFPPASARMRSFLTDQRMGDLTAEKETALEPKDIRDARAFEQMLRYRGKKATFWIRILYRQHTSWQGEVTWVERQKKEYFRSTLELIRLIHSALRAEKQNGGI